MGSRSIVDVEQMPRFDATVLNRGVEEKQKGQQRADGTWNTVKQIKVDDRANEKQRSVSLGRVSLETQAFDGRVVVSCSRHLAMNCVAIEQSGKLWRCVQNGCGEGAWEPA